MTSFSAPVVMVTCPEALGRHALMAVDEGSSLKETVGPFFLRQRLGSAAAGRRSAPHRRRL